MASESPGGEDPRAAGEAHLRPPPPPPRTREKEAKRVKVEREEWREKRETGKDGLRVYDHFGNRGGMEVK